MSSRCALCGEPIGADEQHVCADAMTANVDLNQPAPAPPPPPPVSPAADEPDPLLGTTLADRYELLSRISRGGMGVVYKARHKLLNSTVAVKVLLKKEVDIDQKRFLQEAQLASKLAHPNIVYISDFGLLPDGRPYLVMEFIEGPTLGRVLARSEGGRIDILRACRIASQIARGMQVVHDNGIVHRDLKPDNVTSVEKIARTSQLPIGQRAEVGKPPNPSKARRCASIARSTNRRPREITANDRPSRTCDPSTCRCATNVSVLTLE